MTHDPKVVRSLYRRLLALYPRKFQEQLGEAIEQTFKDLYNERRHRGGWIGFTLWMFAETAAGIVWEYWLLIVKGNAMKNVLMSLRSPALISLLIVMPFIVMELVNRRNLSYEFPIPLFVMLWLLPMAFLFLLIPLVRNVRAGNSLLANPVGLLVRVMFLGLMAFLWLGVLIDQMPCFLGVPNCD